MIYKKINEVADVLNGFAFKSKEYVSDGIRIMRIANVQDGYISDENPCFYPLSSKEEISNYLLKQGDLLISLTGNVGRVGILNSSMLPAALNQRVSCIRPQKDSLNTQYLYYYMLRKAFTQDCINASKGVAQLNLSTRWLEKYEIPVPSLDEQQRIVSRIEELFSSLDNAVETLQKTKEQLAVYRQAVLKEAFEGKLTNSMIMNSGILGEFIEKPRYGTSKKCDYQSGEEFTDVYRIPNIDAKSGVISHTDIKRARFDEKELEDLDLKNGDILIIRSNGSPSIVGTAAMVRENDVNGTFAGYLMRLRIKDSTMILPKFLLFYLSSFEARTYIERVSKSTSGVNNINAQEISKLPIPIFGKEDQLTIIKEIELRISLYDQIEKTVNEALAQSEAMRQSILKEAFEGRL